MTRTKNSSWPAALFAGLAVALLSSGAWAKGIKSKNVNCNFPQQTLADTLSNISSDTVDVIEIIFTGTCIDDLTITEDDVTLRGDGIAAEIQGQINIDGAHRVSLRDFTLTTAGDRGVLAFDGAAIKIDNVDISGAAEINILIARNAFADVRNSTIDGAGNVNIAVSNGAGLDIRDSFIENSGEGGIQISVGSSARISNTSVTDSVTDSVLVNTGSSADLRDVTLNTILGVQEGSHVRIRNSTLSDADDVALAVGKGGTARLFGGGSFLTSGGLDGVIKVTDNSNLHQNRGHDTIDGDINIRRDSYARIQNVDITGNITVSRHSGLRLQDDSPGGGSTLVGSLFVSRDSYAELRGDSPMVITGSVNCNDDESSVQQPLPAGVTVTGGVFCTGF